MAIDDSAHTVDVQHFDGTVDEFDLEHWYELFLEPAQAPEDWAGSLDIEKVDYGVDYHERPHEHWADPLDFFDTYR